ncbi:CDC27 family protein [Candidatus Margulisiibacteriota bacterium]
MYKIITSNEKQFWQNTIENFKKVEHNVSQEDTELYKHALIDTYNKNYKKALKKLKKLYKKYKKNIELSGWIGYNYFYNEDYMAALIRLKLTISLIKTYDTFTPEDHFAYQFIGLCYFHRKKYKKAINAFVKANELQETADSFYHIGLSYYYLKDNDNAYKNLWKSLNLDPNLEYATQTLNLINNKTN